jgi:hypothetical protein
MSKHTKNDIKADVNKNLKRARAIANSRPKRNDKLFDTWSIVHFCSGVAFAWVMPPFTALVLLVLWEPLENLVLSPILAKFDIVFGYETIRNSLSDIFFDTAGILFSMYILLKLVDPPFRLFF